MTTNREKSNILLKKGLNALSDGNFSLADDILNEAIFCNQSCEAIDYDENCEADGYFMKAIIARTKLPKGFEENSDLNDFLIYVTHARTGKYKKYLPVEHIIHGIINYTNIEEWINTTNLPDNNISDIISLEIEAWEKASTTHKDPKIWRKDRFGAWMKIDELNKATDYGWKIRVNPIYGNVNAWQWKNISEIIGDDIVQKIASSGDANIEKKNGCYIATLCYGSYECDEVLTLKKYRDQILTKKTYGKIIIAFYNLFSPKLVAILFNKTKFNTTIKNILIEPIIKRIKKSDH